MDEAAIGRWAASGCPVALALQPIEDSRARTVNSVRKVNMTISLAFLAPDLVFAKAAIDGRVPTEWEWPASATSRPNGLVSAR
jgi:hypothetical protein